jgi:excisionase family DNA binding protein
MSDLETALRQIVADVVREELLAALAHAISQPEMGTGRRYVSPAQAASIAGVAPETIRAWVRQGRLHDYRAGRLLRVSIDDPHASMVPKESSSTRTPEEEADLAIARMQEVNKTRCPDCRHLPSWHLRGGCRAKNCTCKRRMV